MADGVVKPPKLEIGKPQISVCRRHVCLQRQTFFVEINAFQNLTAFDLYQTEIAESIGEVGIELQCARVALRRRVPFSQAPIANAKIVMRLGVVGAGFNRPTSRFRRVFKPLHANQTYGHGIQAHGIVGNKREAFLNHKKRCFKVGSRHHPVRQICSRLHEVRLQKHRPLEGLDGVLFASGSRRGDAENVEKRMGVGKS